MTPPHPHPPGASAWATPPGPATTARATAAPLACRPGCAACCTAPSISSAIPGLPGGKPAGVACVQLDDQGRCKLFGQPDRPAVCVSLQASAEMCGPDRSHALRWLGRLEADTAPGPTVPSGGQAGTQPGAGIARADPARG